MDKLAFGGGTGGDDQKTTEQKIQDEFAGDDALVTILLSNNSFSLNSQSKEDPLASPLSWRKS